MSTARRKLHDVHGATARALGVDRARAKAANGGALHGSSIKAADACTAALLNDPDRRRTHGDFAEHSVTAQGLKQVMRMSRGWAELPADAMESLEMVQHKVARILTGDPATVEHWADLAGYASLVADRLRKAGPK